MGFPTFVAGHGYVSSPPQHDDQGFQYQYQNHNTNTLAFNTNTNTLKIVQYHYQYQYRFSQYQYQFHQYQIEGFTYFEFVIEFFGVYLSLENENVCLGLLNYTGFCGGGEIGRLLVKRLEIFGLTPSDISIAITDCGFDVRSASNILGWHIFPCLAHVANLCVKNILFRNPSTDVPVYFDDEHQNDEEDLQDGICFELIDIARKISSKIHSTGKLTDAQSKIQVDFGKTPLQIVRHNETRWNSLYDCLKRFIQLIIFLQLLFVEELSEFDWDRL